MTVLLVVPIPDVYSIGFKSYDQIETELSDNARPVLEEYAQKNNIPQDAELMIEVGSPKEKIVKTCKDLGADLLIIGSHGQHGISEHIGSTISAVLQKISTNVFISYPKK